MVDFNTSRMLALSQLQHAKDLRESAHGYSVRIQDFIGQCQRAHLELEQARARAEAAQAAAQAAAQLAQTEAAAAMQAAEMAAARAQELARTALDKTLEGAEKAKQVAEDAAALLEELGEETDPESAAARTAAEYALAEAEDLMKRARELVRQLAGMSVSLELDNETIDRLRELFGAEEVPDFTDSGASAQTAATDSTGPGNLVLLPHDDDEITSPGIDLNAAAGQTPSGLLEQLLRAEVPDALRARVDQIIVALRQIATLEANGHDGVAQRMREGWMPIAQAVLEQLDAAVAAAKNGAPAASTPAGTTVSDPALAPPALLPAKPYFDAEAPTAPIGGGFFGVGDYGRTGQDSIYEWLPRAVEAAARATEHGHHLLAASDQVTTVQAFLAAQAVYGIEREEPAGDDGGGMVTIVEMMSREEAIAKLVERGLSAPAILTYLAEHERFLLSQEVYQSEGGGSPAIYGTRAELLSAMGLPEDVPLDLQIAFNTSGSGGGDAWLGATHVSAGVQATGTVERAYHALVDDELAANWVQIGDIGPLGDDVGKMLEEIFEKYGAKTELQKEMIRSILFTFDERYGILANRDFIEAAVEVNNSRRQGFFEKPVGRALLMVAASFLPGGQYVSMALSAGFSLHDGASFGQVLRNAAISYFTVQLGSDFSSVITDALGPNLSPAIANALDGAIRNVGATAVRQILSGGRLDADALLFAALSGGVTSSVSSFVNDSDFGRAMNDVFGDGRAGELLGRLAASSLDGRLSLDEFISAFTASPDRRPNTPGGPQIEVIDGPDGQIAVVRQGDEIFLYDDGSIMRVYEDDNGQFVYVGYNPDGSIGAQSNIPGGAIMGPNDGPDDTWWAIRDELGVNASDSQWSEIEVRLSSAPIGLADGEGSRTLLLSDGSEWEVHMHAENGVLSIIGVDALPAGTVAARALEFSQGSPFGGASSEDALDTISARWPTLSDADISALEATNFGFGDATMLGAVPEGVTPTGSTPSAAELEAQAYTRDEAGVETWRNPESGAIVFQRYPSGMTAAVVGERTIVRDPQGHVVSVQGGTRDEAFALARESGATIFQWNGKPYTTVTKEDLVTASGRSVREYRAYATATGDDSIEGFTAYTTNKEWEALGRGGVDVAYWQARGYTPEQVASYYVLNGNDHRMRSDAANQPRLVGTVSGSVDIPTFFGSGVSPEMDPTGTATVTPPDGATWNEMFRDGVTGAVAFSNNLLSIWQNWDNLPLATRQDLQAAGVQVIAGVLYIPGAIDGARCLITGTSDLLGRYTADGIDLGLCGLALLPGGALAGVVRTTGNVVEAAARTLGTVDNLRPVVASDVGRIIARDLPTGPTSNLPNPNPLHLVDDAHLVDYYRGGSRGADTPLNGTINPSDPAWLGTQRLDDVPYVAVSGDPQNALLYAQNRLRNYETDVAYVHRIRVPEGTQVVDWRSTVPINGEGVGKAPEVEFRILGNLPPGSTVEIWEIRRSPSYNPDLPNSPDQWIITPVPVTLAVTATPTSGASAAAASTSTNVPRELPPLEWGPPP